MQFYDCKIRATWRPTQPETNGAALYGVIAVVAREVAHGVVASAEILPFKVAFFVIRYSWIPVRPRGLPPG